MQRGQLTRGKDADHPAQFPAAVLTTPWAIYRCAMHAPTVGVVGPLRSSNPAGHEVRRTDDSRSSVSFCEMHHVVVRAAKSTFQARDTHRKKGFERRMEGVAKRKRRE